MDTIMDGPPDDGGQQDLNLSTSQWTTQNSQELLNNNTFLYIAV